MSSSKKDFGASRDSAGIGNRLAGRYADTSTGSSTQPERAQAQEPPKMVTRSWYLPAETADSLARTADQLWRALPGTSKHQVLAKLIEAGIARAEDVREDLSQTSQD